MDSTTHHRHSSAVLIKDGDDHYRWFCPPDGRGKRYTASTARKRWPRGTQIADLAALNGNRGGCIYCNHAGHTHAELPRYQTRAEAIEGEGELSEPEFAALGL